MELIDQITEDIKKAMLAKEKTVLDALRGIKKELLEAKTAKGGDGTVSEEMGTKILQKMVKHKVQADLTELEFHNKLNLIFFAS